MLLTTWGEPSQQERLRAKGSVVVGPFDREVSFVAVAAINGGGAIADGAIKNRVADWSGTIGARVDSPIEAARFVVDDRRSTDRVFLEGRLQRASSTIRQRALIVLREAHARRWSDPLFRDSPRSIASSI